MSRPRILSMTVLAAATALVAAGCTQPGDDPPAPPTPGAPAISLPAPDIPAEPGLEDLLDTRTSTREYAGAPLSLQDAATLAWAGYGLQSDGGRTVPSAGGLYPLTIYLLAADVEGLEEGLYAYDPEAHDLTLHLPGDLRQDIEDASPQQGVVTVAPAVMIVAGAPDRLRDRYATAPSASR